MTQYTYTQSLDMLRVESLWSTFAARVPIMTEYCLGYSKEYGTWVSHGYILENRPERFLESAEAYPYLRVVNPIDTRAMIMRIDGRHCHYLIDGDWVRWSDLSGGWHNDRLIDTI